MKLTLDDIAHGIGVGKGFENELGGAAAVHCVVRRVQRCGVLGCVVRAGGKGFREIEMEVRGMDGNRN